LIICHLKRTKLDANRNEKEACDVKSTLARKTWQTYHSAVSYSILQSVKQFGFVHLFDIHGQKHRKAVEFGYLTNTTELTNPDSVLDNGEFEKNSCLRGLMLYNSSHLGKSIKFSEVLRGDRSLGHLLEKNGFNAYPNPNLKSDPDNSYFWGAETVRKYSYGRAHPDLIQLVSESKSHHSELSTQHNNNNNNNKHSTKSGSDSFSHLLRMLCWLYTS